jgi:tubulin polyglutamylase TTLL4
LDERLRAWLIEVNTSPSLGTSSAVDKAVKEPLLAQLLHMVGLVPDHRKRREAAALQTKQQVRPPILVQPFVQGDLTPVNAMIIILM